MSSRRCGNWSQENKAEAKKTVSRRFLVSADGLACKLSVHNLRKEKDAAGVSVFREDGNFSSTFFVILDFSSLSRAETFSQIKSLFKCEKKIKDFFRQLNPASGRRAERKRNSKPFLQFVQLNRILFLCYFSSEKLLNISQNNVLKLWSVDISEQSVFFCFTIFEMRCRCAATALRAQLCNR